MSDNQIILICFSISTIANIYLMLCLLLKEKNVISVEQLASNSPKKSPQFLQAIKKYYSNNEEYNYVDIVEPLGDVVLACREWLIDDQKNSSIDVLFIKEDGKVEILGTCIENEISTH